MLFLFVSFCSACSYCLYGTLYFIIGLDLWFLSFICFRFSKKLKNSAIKLVSKLLLLMVVRRFNTRFVLEHGFSQFHHFYPPFPIFESNRTHCSSILVIVTFLRKGCWHISRDSWTFNWHDRKIKSVAQKDQTSGIRWSRSNVGYGIWTPNQKDRRVFGYASSWSKTNNAFQRDIPLWNSGLV